MVADLPGVDASALPFEADSRFSRKRCRAGIQHFGERELVTVLAELERQGSQDRESPRTTKRYGMSSRRRACVRVVVVTRTATEPISL